MDKLVIEGGRPLKGTIRISGAKNSALPILAATLLTDETCTIKNVPNLRDVHTMLKILRSLGVEFQIHSNKIIIKPKGYKNFVAPYKLVSTMRASFCVLGPILAKLGRASVSLPGGCVIGPRPVDLHLKGIKALGADIKIEGGYVIAKAKNLHGNNIFLGGAFGSSVLATANVMMAATLAKGKTVIENAACEPELTDLTDFLIKMGANIKGGGTPIIEIEGVRRLSGVEHTIIPDRIEAGTYMIATAITKGDLALKDVRIDHLGAIIDKLQEGGITISKIDPSTSLRVNGERSRTIDSGLRVRLTRSLKPVSVTTLPYPGFPTDLQAQILALMCVTKGISIITEKIYPERFIHISELNRMGAQIRREGPHAIVEGIPNLSGAPVMASDLRASAALVLAGLAAKGRTEISRIYHLERGYEDLELKLSGVGAKIWKEKET